MAAPVCQFVDRVGSGALQRLNLNDGKYLTLLQGPDQRPGPDFSPPALKRAVVNTLMAEGASYPASAYDNRVIRLPLLVKACDEAEMAEILETLHRELDRGNNILKWHPTYNSRPVYFRTFRSPDYRLDQAMEGRGELRATLSILAEPFAYGDYVEQTGTLDNDPAGGVNPISFQVVATEGDVPTPLYLFLDSGLVVLGPSIDIPIGVRRHGTPALYFRQAEAMGQGLDTLPQAFDASMSGAGQNYSRTTFAGTPGWGIRLTWDPCPAAGSSVEYRGFYRVFVRVRRSGTTDDIDIKMTYGAGGFATTPEYQAVPKSANSQLIDLGLIRIPPAPDPIYDGYRNVILPVDNTNIYFWARRPAGTETLDWDYAVLVPADEEFGIADTGAGAVSLIWDGPNNIVYEGDMTDVWDRDPIPFVGSIPLVSPDQTNLYVVLVGIERNELTYDLDYTARYWPRHLYIR